MKNNFNFNFPIFAAKLNHKIQESFKKGPIYYLDRVNLDPFKNSTYLNYLILLPQK